MSIFGGLFNNKTATLTREQHVASLHELSYMKRDAANPDMFVFGFTTGQQIAPIRITLGREFPAGMPIISLDPPFSHPWCDEFGRLVRAPQLAHWNNTVSLKGVVEALIQQFKMQPPFPKAVPGPVPALTPVTNPFAPPPAAPSTSTTAAPIAPAMNGAPTMNGSHPPPNVVAPIAAPKPREEPIRPLEDSILSTPLVFDTSRMPQRRADEPTVPSSFPVLSTFSLDELRYLEDEQARTAFLASVDGVKTMTAFVESSLSATDKQTKENVAIAERLNAAKARIHELQTRCRGKEERLAQLQSKVDEHTQRFSVPRVREQLQAAVSQAEKASSSIVLERDPTAATLSDFCDAYIAARTEVHKLKAKHQLSRIPTAIQTG